MDVSTSDTDSELLDLSDSECHTVEELTLACNRNGVSIYDIQRETHKWLSNGGSNDKLIHLKSGNHKHAARTDHQQAVSDDSKSVCPDTIGKEKTDLAKGNPSGIIASAIPTAEAKQNTITQNGDTNFHSPLSVKRKLSKREENRLKRMKGESYVGFSRVLHPVTNKKNSPQDQPRPGKKLGSPCTSIQCINSGKRCCLEFTHNVRQEIFEEFWELDWNAKKAAVRTLVDRSFPQRCRTQNLQNRRHGTFMYHLKINGMRKQVCKSMFLGTIGLGEKTVSNWISFGDAKTPTPSTGKRNRKGGDTLNAENFLKGLPKLPSHYCRKDTKKLYLEPIFRTKSQLFDVYKDKCEKDGVAPVCTRSLFYIFDKMNIGIYQPKKDKCDTCCGWETKNITDEQYNEHIRKKDKAREEKARDREIAVEGKAHVLAMDVQKVLLAPMLNASALYYRTKLIVHNFTVFNLGNHEAKCFLWNETQGTLVSSVFATCLLLFLEEHFTDKLPIIIYSDGATSQNRNAILSNALLNYCVKNGKVIIQKYLEKGHTQMEVDSVHARIETNLKSRSVFLPSDYVDICKTARKKLGGYDVQTMTYSDFRDYFVNRTYKSIRPGTKKDDPHVTDIRQLQYNPDGTMDYKLEHSAPWDKFKLKPRVDVNAMFPRLFTNQNELALSKKKYDDLQAILPVIPENCHEYYKNLPYKNN